MTETLAPAQAVHVMARSAATRQSQPLRGEIASLRSHDMFWMKDILARVGFEIRISDLISYPLDRPMA
jgi:hypothetical protein